MKILQINKFFYRRGGADIYFLDLCDLLRAHGHEVMVFSMRDERNLSSPYEQYFVNNVDFSKKEGLWRQFKKAGHLLYSFEAKQKLEQLIRDERPDIVHLHNFYHQLSTSILPVLKKNHIPTVMTMHDYKLISPVYSLFDGDRICERCKPHAYYRCVTHRCMKGSSFSSAVVALEAYRNWIQKIYIKNIDVFISPSHFLASKFREWGFPKEMVQLYNFIDLASYQPNFGNGVGDGVLFAGRLSGEKGLETLLAAAERLQHIPVTIVGEGPLSQRLRESAPANVIFLGKLSKEEVKQKIRSSRMIVAPSICYENNPLVVIEAMALGKPVVASRLGGIPELVEEEKTGRLFSAGDASTLANIIVNLYDDTETLKIMGTEAFEKAQRLFDSETHYQRLLEIYEGLLIEQK